MPIKIKLEQQQIKYTHTQSTAEQMEDSVQRDHKNINHRQFTAVLWGSGLVGELIEVDSHQNISV